MRYYFIKMIIIVKEKAIKRLQISNFRNVKGYLKPTYEFVDK